MRLGVDCWRIHGTTGVARYITNVVRAWSSGFKSDVFDAVVLFTPRPIDRTRVPLGPGMKEVVLRSDARQLVWQNTRLASACDTEVLWCPAYVTPIATAAKIVVTTHDATNAIHPELYPLSDRLFYRWFYAWRARGATLVVTNNERTRTDIEVHYGVDPGRLRVVGLAPADVFRRLEDREEVSRTVRTILGDDRPYFLSVGKVSTRRNVPTVVEGFARFRERSGLPHRMVVVGRGAALDEVRATAADRGISDQMVHLDYVSDQDLVALYNGAEAFITAATYEANSFTTLEAQTCGAPVVIPDAPGMREMVGGVAEIMPAVGVAEVSAAMERLATDGALRRRLSEMGRKHASRFSWSNTAQGILGVAEEAGADAV
jgi:glycosyltransferase involved in cell wall biosynthesis